MGTCEPICLEETFIPDSIIADLNETSCRQIEQRVPHEYLISNLIAQPRCFNQSMAIFNAIISFSTPQNCSYLDKVVFTNEPNNSTAMQKGCSNRKDCSVVSTSIQLKCAVACECLNYPIPDQRCNIVLMFPPGHAMLGQEICEVTIGNL